MIHWLWLIPAVIIGAGLGMLMLALCVASKESDKHEDYLK